MTVSGSSAYISRQLKSRADIKAALATPTWSVAELFEQDHPSGSSSPTTSDTSFSASANSEKPTTETLTKLIKLAGLNAIPHGSEKEARLLDELNNQLVFVSHISAVDTSGIEPLVRISGPPIEPTFEDLMAGSDAQPLSELQAPETVPPNNWQPTSLAAKKNGHFYQLNTKLGESDA